MKIDEAIIISVPKSYPTPLFNYIENELDRPGFKVKTITTDPGAVAGIEWALPTAVIAYLLKPFFESFLQEAGKDFYEIVKTKMKKFITENREVKTKYVAASSSPNKLSDNYDQSNTISLKVRLHSNLLITVLFNESVPENEIDQMLESLFQLLNYLYEECQKEEIEEIEGNQRPNEYYLIANNETQKWEMLTIQQMIQKYTSK